MTVRSILLGLAPLLLAVAALIAGIVQGGGAAHAQGRPAEECSVLLDASKSMAGFYAASADGFPGLVASLSAGCPHRALIGNGRPRSWPDDLGAARPAADAFGDRTLLGTALADWMASSSPRLLLITDNVADAGGAGAAREQDRFYDLLKATDRGLTHVAMIVLRPPFTGKVFALTGRAWHDFPGPRRALTIYVVERDPAAAARGSVGASTFLRRTEARLERLGYQRYHGPAAPGRGDYLVAELLPLRLEGLGADGTGMRAVAVDGGRGVRVEHGVVHVGRGASDRETAFRVDRIEVATGPDWDFGRAPLEATVTFPASVAFGAAVTGRCLTDPAETPAGLDRRLTLSATCRVPAIWATLSREQRANFRDGAVRDGRLVLAIRANSRALSLKGPMGRYFGMGADTLGDPDGLASVRPDVQERVYRLSELLTRMISDRESRVVITAIPVQLRLSSCGLCVIGRSASTVVPILLVLALIGGAVLLLLRPVDYVVQGEGEARVLRLGFARAVRLRAATAEAASIVSFRMVLRVAVGRHTRWLSAGGGVVTGRKGERALTIARAEKARKPADGAGTRGRTRPARGR